MTDTHPCDGCGEWADIEACYGTTRIYRCETCLTTIAVDLRDHMRHTADRSTP